MVVWEVQIVTENVLEVLQEIFGVLLVTDEVQGIISEVLVVTENFLQRF